MSSQSGKNVKYPGIPSTTDGAGAVVWVETHITQGAAAFPITSSTTMGQGYELAHSNGVKNLWGEPLQFTQLESEHSAQTTCEGFALAGGRVSNFTSGQGLILMKEVLYTISGKRLPMVLHIGSRAMTSQSLNVHCGHDDVMGCADVGWGMVFARNAQETGDLALIARRASEASETPFMNIQDGFLTTHTVENILHPEPEFMKEFVGDPNEKLINYFDPARPVMVGVVQNQDSYMKGKVAQRFFYDTVAHHLEDAFKEFEKNTGRHYDHTLPYRLEDAEYVIVGMGSAMETLQPTVDFLRNKGVKAGALTVLSFRPFPGKQIVERLKNAKVISVIERVDIPLMQSNPLTAEIKAAFTDAMWGENGYAKITTIPKIYSGVYGLGSRDVRPGDLIATYENMMSKNPKTFFSLGIKHPSALTTGEDPDVRPKGAFSMRGHSVGGYGSVTTNKVIATIAADLFKLYVQAYPKYGSEKKGLPTTYYLTIAEDHIKTHCELNYVEFVPLNDVNAFNLGNPLHGLQDGGLLFIQSEETDPLKIWQRIPEKGRKEIRDKKIKVLALDTVKIAKEVSSSPDLVQRMQGIVLLGIFLKSTPYIKQRGLTEAQVFEEVEHSLRKYFGKRGDRVIADNMTAVKKGFTDVFEIPASVINQPDKTPAMAK
jgi:pyruvate-ferredoxin/flavodoxin oxidoreductase